MCGVADCCACACCPQAALPHRPELTCAANFMRFCFWRWLQNHTRTTFFFRSSFSAIAAIYSKEKGFNYFLCDLGIMKQNSHLSKA